MEVLNVGIALLASFGFGVIATLVFLKAREKTVYGKPTSGGGGNPSDNEHQDE
jgi:hypothetical protein